MNWKILFLGILIVSSISLFAQETKQEKPTAKFYGYINWETIFDSHESITTRDGELYLYPSAPNEVNGEDLNKNAQLEMLSLQTRVGAKINGGNVLGAKLSVVIEGDFFATGEAYKRHIRMRHAFMKLKWEKSSLLMGQFWHPMFGPDVFPGIIQFGAGVIYNPLNRAPQVRFDYNVMEDLRLTFAALEHGYHASVGPEDAQRNAAIPDLQFQATYGSKDNFLTGITAGYLVLEPREFLPSPGTYNEETVNSYNLQWFGRVKLSDLTLMAKASYGTNMSQYVMLGGYGVLLDDAGNADGFGYTPYKIASYWFDGNYKLNENLNAGIFVGYTQNMGTVDEVDINNVTARGANIMNIYRVAPRISYSTGPLRFALEYAYNSAAYGVNNPADPDSIDEYGVYKKTENSTNNRIIFAVKFTF
ncbi:MAG: hypothetical protein C0599_12285 [Salinivirgaceae bacterium]|nr:MAG: hypothetical protein C0599_12285 [Salinivirgaceae bacterium]